MKTHGLTTWCLLAITLPAGADQAAPKPVTVPFKLLPTKHMVVRVKVNGKGPYPVIFDTGAPITLLNTKVAKESGLLNQKAPPSGFPLFGTMGPFKIKSLELGDLKSADVPTMVMDHPTVELISKVLGPVEGIVGFPFFARYRMTLDYQAKELTFLPSGFRPPDAFQSLVANVMALADAQPPPPKVLAPPGQWGLVFEKAKGDDKPGVLVRAVRPGSAAATAGVRSGDRLLTLNGRWTDSMADAYQAADFVKPGQAAKVIIQRGEKEVELLITPTPGL
jgi:hypothetical protein